ncbi:16745_t:CDS:1, partial [Racocetra persica]
MPSHIALLIVISSAKNNRLCSYGLAKYKLSDQTSRNIRWKYFFPSNTLPQLFNSGDIVFISGKYVVEHSEECVTVTYASIVGTGKPEREFDLTNVPTCIPHCMISVGINRIPKTTEEFIHFGAEC